MVSIDISLLSDRIYSALREEIFRQTLRAAARLDVHELAAIYGTSVAPVRQALARLHDEGLVEVRPRRGTYVTQVSQRDVAEAFQIRRIVELGAADLLDGQLPPALLDRLREVVARTEALAVGEGFRDYEAFIQYDAEFHRVPLLAVENRRLIRIFDGLHAHITIARGLYPTSNKRASATLAEHQAILEAYARRDAAAVRAALSVHLTNGEKDITRRLGQPSKSDGDGRPGHHFDLSDRPRTRATVDGGGIGEG